MVLRGSLLWLLGAPAAVGASGSIAEQLSAFSSFLDAQGTRVEHALVEERVRSPPDARQLTRDLRALERTLERTLCAPVDDVHGLSRLHHAVIARDAQRCRRCLLLEPAARSGSSARSGGSVRSGGVGKFSACFANQASAKGIRPLHLAVLSGEHSTECLQLLLKAGAEVDATDGSGMTALHAAASLNMAHTVSLLLRAGATARIKGRMAVEPLQLAAFHNAPEAAQV